MIPAAMKKMTVVVFILALTFTGPPIHASAAERLDYKGMIDEVGGFLNEALVLYKKGNIDEAKQKAQSAYFEVYENLEGPIRVNISAKKNIELEEEFIAIRKMIVGREPAAAIEKRINDFMAGLRSLLPDLEEGVELVAEATKEAVQQAGAESRAGGADIEAVWLQAFENIQARLGKALEVYKQGDPKKAAELVLQAQFDEYKNSLLETAVRRYVSQKKDFENNSGFSEVAALIRSGEVPAKIETRIAGLIGELRADLPGLPLVDGAVSKRDMAKSAETRVPEKDWSQVTAGLFAEVDKAAALYKKGETKNAVSALQDAYFDVFEASGMEARIGARDANFKAALEGHFSMLVGRMKKGAPAEDLKGALAAMRVDFDKAVEMLGKGADSPTALFFYSLMIILREGVEAILIITAIIAYLVKSGNKDKLRVIYNGCISALVLSLVTAILLKWVLKTSAASQEIMEGATMLLAAAVLFSVSYWLISKAEARKWMTYIKDKVSDSLSANSLRALWFTAFLAVYREGAETVLFYQALASDAAASGVTAMAGGFVLGCLLLVGIYLGMRHGALKLPLRPFFLFTGALLYYMAFVFAGKGMMELIEGKLFEPSLVSWAPKVPFIGIYPYVQTLVPQLIIILAAAAGLAYMARQRSVAAREAAGGGGK
jgi:high-affinity iron transporter